MKVTIIIPFYNEVERIKFEDFYQIFNRFLQYDFLLVDDGSSDKSIDILEEFKSSFQQLKC
jgi:glycosyltransferase involved in cell wall biosynthesis